jgi:hypothetical protein
LGADAATLSKKAKYTGAPLFITDFLQLETILPFERLEKQ